MVRIIPRTKNIIHPEKGMYSEAADEYSLELKGYPNITNELVRVLAIDPIGTVFTISSASFVGPVGPAGPTGSIVPAGPTGSIGPAGGGPVSPAGYAPYEYYRHSATQTFATDYTHFLNDAGYGNINGGLRTWNAGSSIFYPEKTGSVYILRLEGTIDPVGGNPIFRVDFLVSGSHPDTFTENFRHKQTFEIQVRNNVSHQHIHGVFMVFVDADLFVSGGIFLGSSTGGNITVLTSSLMITAI